jgi:hypothetical protein
MTLVVGVDENNNIVGYSKLNNYDNSYVTPYMEEDLDII